MPRSAMLLMLLSLLLAFGVRPAAADEVRRTSFPPSVVGKWASSTDRCGSRDVVTLSDRGYTGADGRCRVLWIAETPSPVGPNYGVHAVCARKHGHAKTVDSIVRQDGDRLLVGGSFETLAPFLRCP